MSLLLDALRRASQDKAAASDAARPEAVPASPPASGLPFEFDESALTLLPNDRPQTPAPHVAPPVAPPPAERQPEVAPEPAPSAPPASWPVDMETPESRPRTRLMILATVGVLLVAVLGTAWLGWWGVAPTRYWPSLAQGPVKVPTVVVAASAPAAAAGAIETEIEPENAVKNEARPVPLQPAKPARAPALATPRKLAGAAPAAPAAQASTPAPAPTPTSPPAPAAPEPRLASLLQSRVAGPSALESGYAALLQGQLQAAQQAYTQALRGQPEERDALLGLAYIAHQQGQLDQARAYYQRVLRQEPGNPVARAGLLTLSPGEDAQELGRQSRDVAEQNPDSAAAQSLYGHSLVQQDRLADAQRAFQRAWQLEPDVALHAFNLAVALDRMRNYAQARPYYALALTQSTASGGELASRVPQALVQERLRQLQASPEQ